MRETGTDVAFTLMVLGFALQMALDFHPGYTDASLLPHMTFAFFHANVFHLAANMMTLHLLQPSCRNLLAAYAISFATSFLAIAPLPTMGFSGILYVLIGIRTNLFTGRFSFWKGWFVMFLFAGIAMPNVNGLLHLFCFIGGLTIRIISRISNDYAKASR